MPRPTSKVTDWTALLQRELTTKEVRPPKNEGWETLEAIVVTMAISTERARKVIYAGVAAGTVERFEGRILDRAGRLVKGVWFREAVK